MQSDFAHRLVPAELSQGANTVRCSSSALVCCLSLLLTRSVTLRRPSRVVEFADDLPPVIDSYQVKTVGEVESEKVLLGYIPGRGISHHLDRTDVSLVSRFSRAAWCAVESLEEGLGRPCAGATSQIARHD